MADHPMRDREEMQRAHDILIPLVLANEEGDATLEVMKRYLEVLCWVLYHDHNQTFAKNLAAVEAVLKSRGIEIVRCPEMQYPGGRKT